MAIGKLTANMRAIFNFATTLLAASRPSMKTKDDDQTDTLDSQTGAPGSYALGTGAGQANQVFEDARTLAGGANEILVLTNSSLKNPHQETIIATKLIGICIVNTGTVAIQLFGDAVNDVTAMLIANGNGIILRPGSFFCLGVGNLDATKYVVAAGEGIKVTNLDGAVTANYSIQLLLNS